MEQRVWGGGENVGKMRRSLRAKPAHYLLRSPVCRLFTVAVITGIGGAMGNTEIWSWNTKAVIATVIVDHIEPPWHMAVNALSTLQIFLSGCQ